MADETTYESEMNQPVHRPGMESVVNRGAKSAAQVAAQADPRDSSGNRTADDRPVAKAGKIDPFSVSGDPAPKAAPKPAATPPDPATGIGGRDREATIMGQVDDAVNH